MFDPYIDSRTRMQVTRAMGSFNNPYPILRVMKSSLIVFEEFF